MIMTNVLYGTLMENPIIMKFNVNVKKLILTLIIIRLINLKFYTCITKGNGIKRCITLAHFLRTYGHNVVMR